MCKLYTFVSYKWKQLKTYLIRNETLIIDLVFATLFRPLQQTYLQTYKEVCLRADGVKEGTRKHNYILNLQASSLHLPLSTTSTTQEREGEASRRSMREKRAGLEREWARLNYS